MRTSVTTCLLAAAFLFSSAAESISAAETCRLQLRIEAARPEQAGLPVKAIINVPGDGTKYRSAAIMTTDGQRLPAQLASLGLAEKAAGRGCRELHFLLPESSKGGPAELVAELSTDPLPAGGFSWKEVGGQYAELSCDGRRALRYVNVPRAEAEKQGDKYFKVYHHLYDPSGTRLVTKGDRDGLFPHHRGLFYGFSKISYEGAPRVNTWGCDKDHYQSHEGFLSVEAGPVLGRHCVRVAWHGEQRKVFAKEERELTVWRLAGGVMIEFASRLTSLVGRVRLDGDPQHAGFQFRAAQEVADHPKSTYYLRPGGKGEMGATRNWDAKKRDPSCVNLPWNACSFIVGGKRYTAVYLDRPANPKEARYSERDYGRFGSYFEYELEQDRPLMVVYRLWLQDGEMSAREAVRLSGDFVGPVRVRAAL